MAQLWSGRPKTLILTPLNPKLLLVVKPQFTNY